jgi:hypothetical protein
MLFSYMIHSLAKKYGITKRDAASHNEYDFWEMLAFENMDNKRDEYLMKQKQE